MDGYISKDNCTFYAMNNISGITESMRMAVNCLRMTDNKAILYIYKTTRLC